MPIDKSWLTNPNHNSPEYQQGLSSFIEMCKEQVDDRGNVRCACAKCHNSVLISFTKMKFHMHTFGFCPTYKKWIYHGESSSPPVVVVDDIAPRNNMVGVMEDVMQEHTEEDTSLDEGSSGEEDSDCDEFEDLLDKVQSVLYPGCSKFSALDFISKLVHIKVKNRWTNSSFAELLGLLREFESLTQPSSVESHASHPNGATASEKVTGDRCGRIKGFVHKPTSSIAPSSFSEEEQTSPLTKEAPSSFSKEEQTSPLTKDQIKSLFEDQRFIDLVAQFLGSYKPPK